MGELKVKKGDKVWKILSYVGMALLVGWTPVFFAVDLLVSRFPSAVHPLGFYFLFHTCAAFLIPLVFVLRSSLARECERRRRDQDR